MKVADTAWQQRLQGRASSSELAKGAQSALNLIAVRELFINLGARLANELIEGLPSVRMWGKPLPPSARRAYGWERKRIYLNAIWLQGSDDTIIMEALDEELCQPFDSLLNPMESTSNQGAWLAPAMLGLTLSATALQELLNESGRGLMRLKAPLSRSSPMTSRALLRVAILRTRMLMIGLETGRQRMPAGTNRCRAAIQIRRYSQPQLQSQGRASPMLRQCHTNQYNRARHASARRRRLWT
jgi:hypothetical protein